MNNLLSYCGLTDGVMNPSEIDLPELSTFKVKNIQVEVAGSKWSKKKGQNYVHVVIEWSLLRFFDRHAPSTLLVYS